MKARSGGKKASTTPQKTRTKLQDYISKLKKSHAALKQSEERHKIISEMTTDYTCVIAIDPTGPRMVWASDSMKKMTGRDVSDAATMDLWTESIHPDDRGRFMDFVAHTLKSGKPGEIECRSLSKSGTGRSVRVQVKPQCDREGPAREILVGVKDITDRARAEELLRQSANEWAVTFNSIADPIVLMDAGQRITRCNTAFMSLVGKGPREIHGHTCHEIIHGRDCPIDGCSFVKMSRSGRRESMELSIGQRMFEILTYPIRDARGVLTGAVHIMSDMTDRKRIERDKAQVEEELRQALKMEAIGRLAGGVAHDFNNMLAGIMGNAELLQTRLGGDSGSAAYVENIIVSIEHAARLTGQLLAFARKGQYQPVLLDIHRLIKETVEILQNTIDRRIRIEQDLKACPSAVRGDPSQLENALMNLSLNARDAMPEGGRLIFSTDTVKLGGRDLKHFHSGISAGTYIRVRVEDTGTGMSADVQRHLFEPFFTTKEPGKGTGLGLAGVYGNIINHGGAVEASSESGRGSVFTIYLPAVDQEAQERKAPEVGGDAMGKGTILVADDEKVVLDVVQQILKRHGFVVHACRNGLDAVEYYRAHHDEIDLVILDMVMPEMDGRKAFLEMKKVDPEVRALLSSGYSEDRTFHVLAEEGVRGFIQKPFHQAELIEKIQKALGQG